MGWTYEQSQATPIAVRMRWARFMFAKRAAASDRAPVTPERAAAERSEAQRVIDEAAAQVAALEG